jgi:hypothetical protein
MPVNDPFTELSPLSSPKANNMMIIGRTGDQIAALSPTYPGQIVFCNLSGSGFIINHWYGRNQANDQWIDQTEIVLYSAFNNAQTFVTVDKRNATKEMWINHFSGTGAAVNNIFTDTTTARIDCLTGTTTTGVAGLTIGGPLVDFSKSLKFKVKIKTDTTAITTQIVKIGVGMEMAGVANTTLNQIGIEYCDGSANWMIHSANGTSQSNFDTLKAVTANTFYGFTVEFNPGVSVIVTFDDGTVKTKTTDIPSTGNCTQDKVFRLSISNNAAGATSRTLGVLAAYLQYYTNDTKWLQQ